MSKTEGIYFCRYFNFFIPFFSLVLWGAETRVSTDPFASLWLHPGWEDSDRPRWPHHYHGPGCAAGGQLVSFPAVSQIGRKSHHLNSSCIGHSSSPTAGKIPEFFCPWTIVTTSQRRSVELGLIAGSSDSWNFFLLLILSLREVLGKLDKFPSYKLLHTDRVSNYQIVADFLWEKGFPDGSRGKGPACQCSRHKRQGFNPWVRKIPWRRT